MDQFRGLFAKLDTDNNGSISVEELHNEMKKSGILHSEKKIKVGYRESKGYSVILLNVLTMGYYSLNTDITSTEHH